MASSYSSCLLVFAESADLKDGCPGNTDTHTHKMIIDRWTDNKQCTYVPARTSLRPFFSPGPQKLFVNAKVAEGNGEPFSSLPRSWVFCLHTNK